MPVTGRGRTETSQRRPMSPLSIALIVLLVVVVAVAAVVGAFSLGGWQPFGRVVGSGNWVTRGYSLSNFTAVEVGNGFAVEIIRSSSFSINITADDNMFDYIQVLKTDERLAIHLKWGYSYVSSRAREGLVNITMPALYELDLSGGTVGSVEGFSSSHEFIVNLSGGSSLAGDFVTNADAQLDLSGGSTLSMVGAAANLQISASGGSGLELADFPVHNATVDLSGASMATIRLNGRLDADLSGASQLFYIGNPTLGDISTSGGSTISRR